MRLRPSSHSLQRALFFAGAILISAVSIAAFAAPLHAQNSAPQIPYRPHARPLTDSRNTRGQEPLLGHHAAHTPQTPYQRVIAPGLKRAAAAGKIQHLHTSNTQTAKPRDTEASTPNFGGYVAAPKFQAFFISTSDSQTKPNCAGESARLW